MLYRHLKLPYSVQSLYSPTIPRENHYLRQEAETDITRALTLTIDVKCLLLYLQLQTLYFIYC